MTFDRLLALESQLPLGYKLTMTYSDGEYTASALAVSDDSLYAQAVSSHVGDALIDLSTAIKEKA